MYTLASQQQRKSKEAGAKQALVRGARGLRPPPRTRGAARPVATWAAACRAGRGGWSLWRLAAATRYTCGRSPARRWMRLQAATEPALQERVASWIYSEYAGSPVVPTAALLEFLQHAHAVSGLAGLGSCRVSAAGCQGRRGWPVAAGGDAGWHGTCAG